MDYPRDCVDRLLQELKRNDREDEPGSQYAAVNSQTRERYFPHPSREQLEQILDVAHAASLQPEEGRLPKFALAFVSAQGLEKDYDACPFEKPKEFEARVVAKLAPAAAPNRAFFGIWSEPEEHRLGIWGLIHSRKGPLSTEPEGGRPAFLWKNPFLVVRAIAPGVIFVYHWHRLHLVYSRGVAHWGLSGARLQAVLRDRAGLDGSAAEQLCQVVARIVLLGIGGSILVTDPLAPVAPELLDLSYRFGRPNAVLKDAVTDADKRAGHENTRQPLRAALDFVAQLSAVDGVVHITSDLAITGFGGKVMVLQAPEGARFIAEEANPTKEAEEGPTRTLLLSEIPGMRHRSAALFCASQTGQALAIVVSQDGDVTLFGRQDDGAVRRIGPYALGVGLAVS